MPSNSKRVVKVDRRSGFDKHFRNTLTGNVGTLIPIMVDEVIPDTKVNLKVNIAAQLPPLVADTYMNVRLRVEAFAVPHRLCYANFQDFFSDYEQGFLNGSSISDYKGAVPLVSAAQLDPDAKVSNVPGGKEFNQFIVDSFAAGSLSDYMGNSNFMPLDEYGESDELVFPVLPYVAYHLIWQEFYRNPRVQRPAFLPANYLPMAATDSIFLSAASLPFSSVYFDNSGNQPCVAPLTSSSEDYDYDASRYLLADGQTSIFDLRQRNFGLDFFTAAMSSPQQGPAAVVKFGENGDPSNGFSIASLRAQNSIQQFRDRNNLTSPRYQQQIYARYGVAPTDGILQRPALIGAATYDVYTHGVVNSAGTGDETSPSNPFSGKLGSRAGSAAAAGSDFIISGFHAKEPMYIIVLASLVPEVSYSQNMNPVWNRYKGLGSITDMANGILQGVGPQPIKKGSLIGYNSYGDYDSVFAYTDRYSDWMFKNNEVHGHFREGEDLSAFVLQRTFDDDVEFGSEFLTIPTDYLDSALSVTSDALGFGYWMDCMLDYKVSMPLQEYAIPTLQDPGYEHGKSVVLRKNGQIL